MEVLQANPLTKGGVFVPRTWKGSCMAWFPWHKRRNRWEEPGKEVNSPSHRLQSFPWLMQVFVLISI